MAETLPKRPREESHEDHSSSELDEPSPSPKRPKPFSNILNLLDEDDLEPSYEPSQDFSAILTTLQQELSSSTSSDSVADFDFDSVPSTEETEAELFNQAAAAAASAGGADDEEGLGSVMRHLLEASDDELGIPNIGDDNIIEINSGENFPFALTDNGLWELEDEAANYYTVLQSELFM